MYNACNFPSLVNGPQPTAEESGEDVLRDRRISSVTTECGRAVIFSDV